MQRVPSGKITELMYFRAVDATNFFTSEINQAAYTVYRSRGGATEVIMTTPTIVQIDAITMAGVYTLLLDEDMVITDGKLTEQMLFFITHAGMYPLTKEIQLYVPLPSDLNLS